MGKCIYNIYYRSPVTAEKYGQPYMYRTFLYETTVGDYASEIFYVKGFTHNNIIEYYVMK